MGGLTGGGTSAPSSKQHSLQNMVTIAGSGGISSSNGIGITTGPAPSTSSPVTSGGGGAVSASGVSGGGGKAIQAIIMAGAGNALYPLTEPSNLPKALLPIANKPMIYYPLHWLEGARVSSILILTSPASSLAITDYIQKSYESPNHAGGQHASPSISVAEVPYNIGTADALRLVRSKIVTDFIVFSCDLVTDIPAHYVIDTFLLNNPSLLTLFYEPPPSEVAARKGSAEEDVELVGFDDNQNLLYLALLEDIPDALRISTSLLRKHPKLHITSSLRDSHLYIFQHWVLDFVVKNKTLSSVRFDLVPALIKAQYTKTMAMRQDGLLIPSDPLALAKHYSTTSSPHSFFPLGLDGTSNSLGVSGTLDPRGKNVIPVVAADFYPVCKCLVYKEGITQRSENSSEYGELNRMVAKNVVERLPASSTIHSKTQVGPDSMVGIGCKINERCSLKKTVIGNHCVIGKGVKLIHCVLMDYVVVEDNVKLENCILCSHCRVEEKVSLKDCDVGAHFVIPKELAARGEHFVISAE